MKINSLDLNGLYELISYEKKDNRGSFINLFRVDNEQFKKIWANRKIVQINISNNKKVGTIRGLHMQEAPYSEAKIVRCLQGKVWDVAVDLRPDSDTYCCWCAVELSPEKLNSIFIPEGFAHGFQVLKRDSQLLYLHTGEWKADAEKGFRWDDLKLGIKWPLPLTEISSKDQFLPYLSI